MGVSFHVVNLLNALPCSDLTSSVVVLIFRLERTVTVIDLSSVSTRPHHWFSNAQEVSSIILTYGIQCKDSTTDM